MKKYILASTVLAYMFVLAADVDASDNNRRRAVTLKLGSGGKLAPATESAGGKTAKGKLLTDQGTLNQFFDVSLKKAQNQIKQANAEGVLMASGVEILLASSEAAE